MGNKNSQFDVKFDRSLYFTHQPVTGNISLDIKDNAEVTNVKLIYVTLKCRLVRHTKNGGDTSINIYESAPISLATPQPPATTLNFKQGNYLWPFSIQLPEYLPPTFKTRAEDLMYFVEVIFKRACFRSNIRDARKITICPRVNLQHIPNTPFTFTDHKQNMNGILVSGTLNKYGFVCAETIKCKLEIFNTKRLLIKNIVTSMFCTCTVRAGLPSVHIFQSNNDVKTILEQTKTLINNTRDEMISELIEIELPSVYFPPTYNFACEIKGLLGTGTCSINISYTLKIDLKVEGILTNISVSVPITIGTIRHLVGQDDQLPRITYPNPTDDTNICDDLE
jgi:hypothetical protein